MSKYLQIPCVLVLIATAFTTIDIYAQYNFLNHILIVTAIVYVQSQLFVAAYQKEAGAIWAFGGFALLVFGGMYDILHANRVISTGYFITPYSSTVFIISQSLLQGYYHEQAYHTIDRLSRNLQQEVDFKQKRWRKRIEILRTKLLRQKVC